MRKRGGKEADSSSAEVKKARRKQQKKDGVSKQWMKRCLVLLFLMVVLMPIVVKLPALIQYFVYIYRIRLLYFADLNRPDEFSLNHTINMYLTSEEGISLGMWHTVPDSRWKEAQGKDLAWYQSTLSQGSPVFIYFHGNTNTRKEPHRVEVAKVLSALDYHVLVPEYRGFGDSTGEPTEDGLTMDALYVYNWVKAHCGNCPVVFWGHSLGTAVSTNAAVKLIEQDVVVDGVILEGVHPNIDPNLGFHPFSWYYWRFPGQGYLFPEPWAANKVVFPTEENLKKMKSPILFLHSEGDHVTPPHVCEQRYNTAVNSQSAERVKLVMFERSLGYLHNGLQKDPRLPAIIKNFMDSLFHGKDKKR